MQLTININNPAEISLAIQALGKLLPTNTLAGAQPQPQVGENSGSVSTTVFPFSVGAGTVSDGVASATPALVKKVKVRKETAPAPVEAVAQPSPAPAAATQAFDDVPEIPAPTPETQVDAAGVPTLDAARDALKVHSAKNGMEASIALLAKFGAARVSEVPEASRATFVAEATA